MLACLALIIASCSRVRGRQLIHQIRARFPLERIVQAHEAQEGGKVMGNIVVEVGKE